MSEKKTCKLVLLEKFRFRNPPYGYVGCSNCKNPMPEITPSINRPFEKLEVKYCPYCGAEIDWEDNRHEEN